MSVFYIVPWEAILSKVLTVQSLWKTRDLGSEAKPQLLAVTSDFDKAHRYAVVRIKIAGTH